MTMRADIELVHVTEGRLRLRVSQRARDPGFFASLAKEISRHPGVREVRTSVRTGSVLVLFEGELPALLEHLRSLPSMELVPSSSHAPMREVSRLLGLLDGSLARETHGAASLGSLTFLATLLAGLYQARHGRLLPAGVTLIKYALEAVERGAARDVVRT
jgi:hypothetical protein